MPKQRGQNTVSDLMTRFRAFILWAVDNGYTVNNPFKNFTISEIVYGTPIYISNEERKQLLETDLSADREIETQRDIFVFQCLVGCRVGDYFKMTYSNVVDGAIEYIKHKTKEDWQEVHKPLYELASSHMVRRTFIGNIYKRVDPNMVAALSGHKEGSKAFARYRTIDDDMKKEMIGYLE